MIQSNRSNTQENIAEERGVKNEEGLEEGEEGAEEDATGSTSEE